MNNDKDVQFVLRGNLTRMWVHLCGEYDKEIGYCLSFPFPKQNLEKIQIYIVWSYSIRWCVDACKVRTFSGLVHLCFFIWAFHWSLGLSRHCDILLAVFFPFSFLSNDGEHVHVTNAVTWKWHVICIAHTHNYYTLP